MKLIVGLIAIGLPFLTSYFAGSRITSISASYYEGGWSQSIFVGFLFAIAAFLLAYNGLTKVDMILSKVAGVAGLGVALFPCQCGTHDERIPHVHAICAAIMFLVLAYFCYGFFRNAKAKGHAQAKARAAIYAVCGMAILVSIVSLAIYNLVGKELPGDRFTFYGEATGLIAFGISWLTASRVLPVLTRQDERFSPLREQNPR
ncbi:MAG TPA: hypothetical protein VGH80_07435 [Xanthomonadaceae bacterium]|jgi:hypothetical protein